MSEGVAVADASMLATLRALRRLGFELRVGDLRIVDEKDPQGNAAGTTVIVRLPLRITAEMQQDKAFEVRALEEAGAPAPGLVKFDE